MLQFLQLSLSRKSSSAEITSETSDIPFFIQLWIALENLLRWATKEAGVTTLANAFSAMRPRWTDCLTCCVTRNLRVLIPNALLTAFQDHHRLLAAMDGEPGCLCCFGSFWRSRFFSQGLQVFDAISWKNHHLDLIKAEMTSHHRRVPPSIKAQGELTWITYCLEAWVLLKKKIYSASDTVFSYEDHFKWVKWELFKPRRDPDSQVI